MNKSKTSSKFNVTKDKSKRTYKNITYDSITEMKFYKDYIEPRIISGEIKSYKRQVKFVLQPDFIYQDKKILPINYIADYVLTYSDDKDVVIDIKGMPDSVSLLKAKLFKYQYNTIDYRWICYSLIDSDGTDDGWVPYEKVKQGRKKRKQLKETTKCQS